MGSATASEHLLFERYVNAATWARENGGLTILVSHRFSTVRAADQILVAADQILVMENGRLTASGSHDELVAAGGTYAEMFRLQAQAYS